MRETDADAVAAIARERGHAMPRKLIRHLIKTDPENCWVVETKAGVHAATMTSHREGLTILSLLEVAAGHHENGYVGVLADQVRPLLEDSARAIAVAGHESARRLYRWGFDVHPAMRAVGQLDRSSVPKIKRVRPGTPDDIELCQRVDRLLRGAARGPDHELLMSGANLFIAQSKHGTGYAYARPNGSPLTVAAAQTDIARELLTASLVSGPPEATVAVGNLTGEQRWAFDVVRRLGLDLQVHGPVFVRGMALPSPYLAHDWLG